MKILVTHFSPDLDSATACWLIKRFYPTWQNAKIEFVPAGATLNNQPPDDNPNIIHLDTGLGKFDHHQTDKKSVSSTKLVFDFLNTKGFIKKQNLTALDRMVELVTALDHFGEVEFPEPTADIYDLGLHQLIEGTKPSFKNSGLLMDYVFILLDGALQIFKNKIKAEEDIKRGYILSSKWGKSLVVETRNEEAIKLALKMGYQLVARKDPDTGQIRIKTNPNSKTDLTLLYNKLKKIDSNATWYFHVSGNMLLNGSSKNPKTIPSIISLQKLIAIIKEIK